MLQNYTNNLQIIDYKVLELINIVLKANKLILQALNCDEKNMEILEEATKDLKTASLQAKKIDEKIVKILALYSPEARDLRQMISFLKITSALLRASSNTKAYIKNFSVYYDILEELEIKDIAIKFQNSCVSCLENLEILSKADRKEAEGIFKKISVFEKQNDKDYKILSKKMKTYNKTMDLDKLIKSLDVLKKSERITDRALEIAYSLKYSKFGGGL